MTSFLEPSDIKLSDIVSRRDSSAAPRMTVVSITCGFATCRWFEGAHVTCAYPVPDAREMMLSIFHTSDLILATWPDNKE
jgi:uncharacterized protein YodC (DUF2158 family)